MVSVSDFFFIDVFIITFFLIIADDVFISIIARWSVDIIDDYYFSMLMYIYYYFRYFAAFHIDYFRRYFALLLIITLFRFQW